MKTSILVRVKFIIISFVLSITICICAYGDTDPCSQIPEQPGFNGRQINKSGPVPSLLINSSAPFSAGEGKTAALLKAGSYSAEAGNLYRQEILSVLCPKLRINHYGVTVRRDGPYSLCKPEPVEPSSPIQTFKVGQ